MGAAEERHVIHVLSQRARFTRGQKDATHLILREQPRRLGTFPDSFGISQILDNIYRLACEVAKAIGLRNWVWLERIVWVAWESNSREWTLVQLTGRSSQMKRHVEVHSIGVISPCQV